MERCLRGVSIWKSHGIPPALSELAVTWVVGSQGIKWSRDDDVWDSILKENGVLREGNDR
jgi:hypothetical protein